MELLVVMLLIDTQNDIFSAYDDGYPVTENKAFATSVDLQPGDLGELRLQVNGYFDDHDGYFDNIVVAPSPVECGDIGTVYMPVDFKDFASMAVGWLRCTDPANILCF